MAPTDGGPSPIAQRVAHDRVISTVDPQAGHAHKTVHRRQDSFKAHLAVEPDSGIITDCVLTKASGDGTHDAAVAAQLLDDDTYPVTVLGDSAYGSGELRTHLSEAGQVDRVKSAPLRPAVVGGFSIDDFTINHQAKTVTCPAAMTRPISPAGYVTSGPHAAAAHYGPSAPPTARGAACTCDLIMSSNDQLAPIRETPSGATNTDNTDLSWNAPSPG